MAALFLPDEIEKSGNEVGRRAKNYAEREWCNCPLYTCQRCKHNFFAHLAQKNTKHCTQTYDQQETQTQHRDSTSQQWASFGFSSPTLLDTLQLAPPFMAPALRAQKSYWLHPMPQHIIG